MTFKLLLFIVGRGPCVGPGVLMSPLMRELHDNGRCMIGIDNAIVAWADARPAPTLVDRFSR